MKQIVKGALQVTGFSIGLLGFIVCMCECETFEKQIVTACIGIGMVGVGFLLCKLGKAGEEDVAG